MPYTMIQETTETENSGEVPPPVRRDRSWPKPASQAVLNILRAMPGVDLALVQLQNQWPEIIGQPLCQLCRPDKILSSRGQSQNLTLQIQVAGAAGLEIQHLQPQLIEKINRYAGYGWIGQIKIVQGLIIKPPPAKKKPAASAHAEPRTQLPEIENPNLRQALEGLGDAIAD